MFRLFGLKTRGQRSNWIRKVQVGHPFNAAIYLSQFSVVADVLLTPLSLARSSCFDSANKKSRRNVDAVLSERVIISESYIRWAKCYRFAVIGTRRGRGYIVVIQSGCFKMGDVHFQPKRKLAIRKHVPCEYISCLWQVYATLFSWFFNFFPD